MALVTGLYGWLVSKLCMFQMVFGLVLASTLQIKLHLQSAKRIVAGSGRLEVEHGYEN